MILFCHLDCGTGFGSDGHWTCNDGAWETVGTVGCVDILAPDVSSLTPIDDEANVPVDYSSFSVTFDEAVFAGADGLKLLLIPDTALDDFLDGASGGYLT